MTERDLITSKDLRDAQALSTQLDGQLPAALLRLGALSEEALLSAMSEQLDLTIPLSLLVDKKALCCLA